MKSLFVIFLHLSCLLSQTTEMVKLKRGGQYLGFQFTKDDNVLYKKKKLFVNARISKGLVETISISVSPNKDFACLILHDMDGQRSYEVVNLETGNNSFSRAPAYTVDWSPESKFVAVYGGYEGDFIQISNLSTMNSFDGVFLGTDTLLFNKDGKGVWSEKYYSFYAISHLNPYSQYDLSAISDTTDKYLFKVNLENNHVIRQKITSKKSDR